PAAARPGLFGALAGRDVVIVFVESYGRTVFEDPLYRSRQHDRLRAGEAALRAAGLGMRSGWLGSPIRGGQSWLAHATLASGLAISDQGMYAALLSSGRQGLFHLAAAAGYDTLAVAPAITLPWPEAERLGFARTLEAADLGYRGPAFGWVTMPDQFTLEAFERLAPGDGPRMTEIALISSHAPWTPLPRMVPREDLGDGRIFGPMAAAGPAPRALWADPGRVRLHYALALDYALAAVFDWAARPRATPPVLLVLGDHQPGGPVAPSGGDQVPAHLIAPPEVLALFDGWGWQEGLQPDPQAPAWPMERFRDRFLAATAAPGAGP
ncbi:sulfatase-like hydrolase/transferase, partial [Mangrovicoccus algicola]|nr:sulfatase [Mangrovicoccus algicola]